MATEAEKEKFKAELYDFCCELIEETTDFDKLRAAIKDSKDLKRLIDKVPDKVVAEN